MGVELVAASSEALSLATAPVTAAPFTMACWFNSNDAASVYALMGVGDLSVLDNYFLLGLNGTVAPDPVQVVAADGSVGVGSTTTGFTAGTRHHAAAVITSPTSRAVFIDGGSKGTDTTSITPTGIDNTKIGRIPRSGNFNYLDGSIAEAAIWNVALTDGEVAILGLGYSALLVRPASLVFYAPCVRDVSAGNWREYIGGVPLSEIGTPTVAVHAIPLFQPGLPHIITIPGAAPGTVRGRSNHAGAMVTRAFV